MTALLDGGAVTERHLRLVRATIAAVPPRDSRRLVLALAHEELRRRLSAAVCPDDVVPPPRYATVSWESADQLQEYRALVERIRAKVDEVIPADAAIAVVSRGDPELLQLGARQAAHFPCTADGAYAGYHPRDDDAALAHLAEHVRAGVGFLLVPATAFWWLEHYAGFATRIETGLVHLDRDCAIFDLRPT